MIPNQNILNYKVVDCIENYNFGIDHSIFEVVWKFLISKIHELKQF